MGNIKAAAGMAGIDRDCHYDWLAGDEAYQAKWDRLQAKIGDDLEQEAIRRAFKGVPRKRFYQGEPIIDPATGAQYIENEYSDRLLIRLLEARKADQYRRNIDLTSGGDQLRQTAERLLTDPKLRDKALALSDELLQLDDDGAAE